jgi:predicted transcriptional regulator
MVQNTESYQQMLDALEKLAEFAGIKQGFVDIEAGRTTSIREFEEEMQQKYGISS